MGKVKIDKHDYLRVILTDTLPYEVPINFLNEGVYFHLKRQLGLYGNKTGLDKSTLDFLDVFLNYNEFTKPYNYRIHKNSTSKRLLSIPHPSIQKRIANIYKEYDSLITELCSRSPISLRAANKVASRFYEKELVNYSVVDPRNGVEIESDAFEKTSAFASSYFTYKKYNFLYKYYDSYESHRIEKKFGHLTRFDISKCFHNIFVPSFGWAVKGKSFSKRYSDYFSLEDKFQRLMMDANDSDNSGIIIGPEFSRIFAEIILQNIDLNIIDEIKSKLNLVFDKDYTLRRYVDDYFLYTKERTVANSILDIILSELEKYKLFVNESKTEFTEVPFITGLTIAKMDIKDLVRITFEKIVSTDINNESEFKFFKSLSPAREANRFIKNLKRLVKENNVNYESLSGYALGEIRRELFKLLEDDNVIKCISDKKTDSLLDLLLFSLEISFFIYSMDIRVRTTYIITQLVVRINLITEEAHSSFKDDVRKKIYDESVLLLSKMKDKGKANSIETLNLLISIKTNFEDYPISDDDILNLFDIVRDKESNVIVKKQNCQIGYFQLMVLSSFIESNHPIINDFIEQEVFRVFDELDGVEIKNTTDATCMFFDSMSNPYFSEDFKIKLFKMVSNKVFDEKVNDDVMYYLRDNEWFFTWKKENLAQILMKKELRSPY
ncbi:RNA-directed DNA polymerase [Pectobacterium brasiliense]|uniref:antiviral reverse transcriptase Drt3b n=1 Tax=Pectobacterium brasiliense TaxID=180957 RepID=UPI00069AE0C5|nr:antiviral reverse transcriptase Drt3b [Pectobacterium brasiliense]MCG5047145.1 RNA-directed DNA polymerase [Pectobacterium brasiliense]